MICTEWSEFRSPDLKRLRNNMKSPLIFDGRNMWEPEDMAAMGFVYRCIGRPQVEPTAVNS